MHNKLQFELWMTLLTDWMDAKDIAVAFDVLTRCYHAGMTPMEASIVCELELVHAEC